MGGVFFLHAQAAMAEIKAGDTAIDVLRENRSELIRASAVPAIMPTLVPRAIQLLAQCHPKAQIIMDGEAYLTDHPAYYDSQAQSLVRLPIDLRLTVPWKISLCQRKNSVPSPALTALIECLEGLVREAEQANSLI
jgi:DNA-binding transcriptional LysR family regulator